ncbi:MAG: 3-isopropylmalate dehydratase [Chloroflexota bacterium]|nr:3-isopropylmalate dehydratase [Chloroflexota bacterium]
MITTHRVWVYGDDVNTDLIFPGKYTYTLRDPAAIAAHALEDLDPTFAANAHPGDAIIAGRSWGMGSSREQAVTALKTLGVRLIVAESFGGLYFRNCINQGIYAAVVPGLYKRVTTGDVIEYDADSATITAAGETFALPSLPDQVRAILEAGGLLALLKRR